MFYKLKNFPKYVWILLAILALGIFVRTWHFEKWMVFNPDQARDATMVDDVLAGRAPLPLLGPEAGNTHFSLGPWFYHLEILSANIFGSAPWKLAIPDLIFSLLTIPLFYFFVRKYFSLNISLLTTFFISISYFMVRYSRFAFNPNSIPFFLLLFLLGMLYYMENDRRKILGGGVLVGVAIGVGMQLHILLFFIMPTVAGLIFLWLLIMKKRPALQLLGGIGLAFACIAVLNTSQIIYFTKHTHNANTFKKAVFQTSGGNDFGKNLPMDILGQAQANLNLISSWGNDEEVNFYSELKTVQRYRDRGLPYNPKNKHTFLLVGAAILYSVAGYGLIVYFWKKETDEKRKNFLILTGLYGVVSLIAMFPIISQASLRYYIISFFLPFVFLGLLCEYALRQKARGWEKVLIGMIVATSAFSQLQTLNMVRINFENGTASNSNYAIWGEVNQMMDYIKENSVTGEEVYIIGRTDYFSRFYKPFLYLGGKMGVNIQRGDKEDKIPAGAHVFRVQQEESAKKLQKRTFRGDTVENYKTFGKISIINFKH